ncbi:Golgi apparatus membrane protein TVP38 [Amylostereum chailletii]|nr:Golgi apparatus membrane protein TVP38 [Amylostereum chailletii]
MTSVDQDGIPRPKRIAWAISMFNHYVKASVRRFLKLPLAGKFAVGFLALFYASLVAFIVIVRPARIAQFLYDTAQRISNHPLGWMSLAGLILLVSFPPMVGHTTALNLCGFAYGIKGFAIAGPASLFASAFVFLVLRYFFSKRLHRWSSTSEKWQALENVINAKGLPLMVLIRLSPFPPWVYSNSLFASVKVVSIWQFMAATICTFPRYLLYVFIGSRISMLSDGKQRSEMDTHTKVINWLLIVVGIAAGVAAGWIVYVQMQRELNKVGTNTGHLAAEAIDDADEGAPLLNPTFSDDDV